MLDYLLQAKLSPPEYYVVPSLTRYFDHIQSRPFVRTSAESLGNTFRQLSFDLENAPKLERKAESSKKKEKAPKAPTDEEAKAASKTGTEPSNAPTTEKAQKKEKKEKNKETEPKAGSSKDMSGGKKGGGTKTPAADEGEPVPSMIDLRVGHIVDGEAFSSISRTSHTKPLIYPVIKHPDADGLYVEVSEMLSSLLANHLTHLPAAN